ncbi:TIGR02444 family protein [Shewanella aestuarii]|uniref:TIGR02444 family protein n=1 Tax=Shewanella aestuarii TaxID=1028752 RepID=A0A6G9QGJ2_9GAMM|nr:TIGR02444 family protein [Shewanella aestuarii]QIR13640.1 TIGR02444 family protein [Shewanella aestuarii]
MTAKPLSKGKFCDKVWQECEQRYLSAPKGYIALQDSHQVNVNLLLLAQYLDQQNYVLSAEQWQQMAQVIEQWEQTILKPFRGLRRLAKAHLTEDEYQKMLEVELIMERKSQKMLLRHLNNMPANIPLSTLSNTNNTQGYLGLFGLTQENLIL